MKDERFERSCSLLGEDAFRRIRELRVAVFGVGGVGGWCAEALLRTGVRRLVLVDDDAVAVSNINRQRQTQPSTFGRIKVEALREMLLATIPDAEIQAVSERYTPETAARFNPVFESADVVIDAIDSVECKAHLINRCTGQAPAGAHLPVIYSSMGAALRLDPTKVRISPFDKITGDGLARALRGRFRKAGIPIPHHMCVHSDEPPVAQRRNAQAERGGSDGDTEGGNQDSSRQPAAIKGSLMPVTCAFGMALAYLATSRAGAVLRKRTP